MAKKIIWSYLPITTLTVSPHLGSPSCPRRQQQTLNYCCPTAEEKGRAEGCVHTHRTGMLKERLWVLSGHLTPCHLKGLCPLDTTSRSLQIPSLDIAKWHLTESHYNRGVIGMAVGRAHVSGPSSILQTALMAFVSPMDPSITNHLGEQEMPFV